MYIPYIHLSAQLTIRDCEEVFKSTGFFIFFFWLLTRTGKFLAFSTLPPLKVGKKGYTIFVEMDLVDRTWNDIFQFWKSCLLNSKPLQTNSNNSIPTSNSEVYTSGLCQRYVWAYLTHFDKFKCRSIWIVYVQVVILANTSVPKLLSNRWRCSIY